MINCYNVNYKVYNNLCQDIRNLQAKILMKAPRLCKLKCC